MPGWLSLASSLGVLDHDDDGVTAQEELWDVPFFVLWSSPLTLTFLWHFSPHLKNTFEDHVHVSVKRFHVAKKLAIIATVDQHLAVCLHCFREQCQWSLVEDFLVRHMRLLLFLSVDHFSLCL